MLDTVATTGSSLAGNYAVRQAVDVGTDTVLDTVQAVARGEDVNAKTIGRDLLRNTLMAGAQAAGGSGKNGIVDGSGNGKAGTGGAGNNIKPVSDALGAHSVSKTGGKRAGGANTIFDYKNSVTQSNGNYYANKLTIDEIGKIEAKGQDFSNLNKSLQQSRISTECGVSNVYKYSDDKGVKFMIHEVTDANNLLKLPTPVGVLNLEKSIL